MKLTEEIRAQARRAGFDKIGISRVEKLDDRNGLQEWLAKGQHGEMRWMAADPEKRTDPSRIWSEARSVIALALNYYTPIQHSEQPERGKISRYAWGEDYHRILKERLADLARRIVELEPAARGLYYSDTGPMMDKAWAHKGGVGWIGKHSNLITRALGSWVFLGEILLNLELEYDPEDRKYCGTCHRCIDACPTRAIVAPYVVDARLCISYLTIELRGAIPRELRPLVGTRIFGCDDCQDVCPWNRFAQPSLEKGFYPDEHNRAPVLIDLMQMTESEFRERFQNSAVRRAKHSGFLRNVAVALGNSRDRAAIPVLSDTLLQHSEPLVRSHAAWALGEIGGENSWETLGKASQRETNVSVLEEVQLALAKMGRGGNAPHCSPADAEHPPYPTATTLTL
jgi:epoxyqueuosine reductase